MENKSPILITQKEAAAVMRVSMPTYYNIIKNLDFPLVSVGRRKFVHREKLEEWLRNKSGKELYAPSHYYSSVKKTSEHASVLHDESRTYDQNPIVITMRSILDDLPGAIIQMSSEDFRAVVSKRTGKNVAATIEKFGRMINALIPNLMEFDGIALERPRRGVRFYKVKSKGGAT